MNTRTRSTLFRISIFSGNFFAPVYVIYLLGLDLSYLEISILHIAKDVTGFLLEVPSGVLADLHSRSRTLALAGIMLAFAAGFFSLAQGFLGFLPAFILWGASYAFVSGTDVAVAHETSSSPKEFSDTVSTMTSLRRVSSAVSQTTGPLLYSLNVYAPFAVSGVIALLQSRESIRLREVEGTHQRQTVASYLRSIRETLSRSRLFVVMLGYAVLTSTVFSLFVFQQPKLVAAGFPVAALSIAYAVIFLLSLVATVLARRIRSSPGPGVAPFAVVLLLAGSILGLSQVHAPVVVVLLMVVQSSVLSVIIQQRTIHLNNLLSDDSRSGLLSTQSLINNILRALLVLATGWIADTHGIDAAILVLCFAPLLVLPVLAARLFRARPT